MSNPHIDLIDALRRFFEGFPGFVESNANRLGENIQFVLEYPERNLRIVITTPTVRFGSGLYGTKKGYKISFQIEHNNKTCLEFKDTRAIIGWSDVATKKIDTLQKLVEGGLPCPNPGCKGAYPRPIKESARQAGRPRPTHYMVYECTGGCQTRPETTFGAGVKTAVAKYIKKK